ncbi:MAG: hypothetical protein EOO88_28955 [Pedobacter sp.]|nr:MAG: hypothetical protein EOO88_28955 [Pedobacter sp.]
MEEGKSLPNMGSARQNIEAKLYEQLFKELKKELPLQPNPDFSDRVLSQIDGLETPSTQSKTYGWLWVGFSICLLVVILAMASLDWNITDLVSVVAIIKPIKGGLVFGLLSLLLVQLLDFKLIREPSLPKLN